MPVKVSHSQLEVWRQLLVALARRGFAMTGTNGVALGRHHVYRPVEGEDYVGSSSGAPWWSDASGEQLPVLYRILHTRAAAPAKDGASQPVIQVLDIHDLSEAEVKSLKLVAASLSDRTSGRTFLAMVATPGAVLGEPEEARLMAEMQGEMGRVGA